MSINFPSSVFDLTSCTEVKLSIQIFLGIPSVSCEAQVDFGVMEVVKDGKNLGCSDLKYFSMAANNLLFHEMERWGKNRFNKLDLGSGYRDNDQLFQFKYRFNPM